MKKRYILMATACALCACDPVEEDKSFDPIEVSSQEISDAFSFVQKDKDGNAAEDGNYFTYNTSPSQIVKVFNYKADGSENVLALGSSGSFTIAPSRGSDPQQKFYVCLYNSEGEKIVAEKTATVFVKQDLTAVEKLFCSNSGRKTYKWNTNAPGGCIWGNMAYQGTDGSAVYTENSTKWWGVVSDTEFADQLVHSVSGQLTGEESFDAYMVFTEDGIIEKYDANGTKLNETTYSVVEQTENTAWAKYHLLTGENSVLWPFEMNGGGKYVTEFEVVYISPCAMTLVYPDGGNFSSFGGWDEAAFWQFKADDYEGALAGVDDQPKAWTWNTSAPGGCIWGNMAYQGTEGSIVYTENSTKWWGVVSDTEFADQLTHSVSGALTGEESFNAYFTLAQNGDLNKYDGEGKLLNTTTWSFNTDKKTVHEDGSVWAVGHLETGENSVLWPFEMNGGGKYVTDYEVVYVDDDHLTLVYPDGGNFSSFGGWYEAAYWQFKTKK